MLWCNMIYEQCKISSLNLFLRCYDAILQMVSEKVAQFQTSCQLVYVSDWKCFKGQVEAANQYGYCPHSHKDAPTHRSTFWMLDVEGSMTRRLSANTYRRWIMLSPCLSKSSCTTIIHSIVTWDSVLPGSYSWQVLSDYSNLLIIWELKKAFESAVFTLCPGPYFLFVFISYRKPYVSQLGVHYVHAW